MVKVSLELSTFAHSTESEGKVLEALLRAVPEDLRPALARDVRVESLEGYYGNVIKVLRLSIGRDLGARVLRHVICSLDTSNREILLATLESRVERRRLRLYIRLNKQELYLGRVVLDEGGDVVKLVASFEGVHHRDLRRVLAELGEGCGD